MVGGAAMPARPNSLARMAARPVESGSAFFFAVGNKGDHIGELTVVGKCTQHLFFGGDQLEEVELAGLLENTHQHTRTGLADEVDGDTPIKVIGLWDQITKTSCRWRQGVSRDGGKTWEWNWIMDWTRA